MRRDIAVGLFTLRADPSSAQRLGGVAADFWYPSMRRLPHPAFVLRAPTFSHSNQETSMVDKVIATPAALELVAFLKT